MVNRCYVPLFSCGPHTSTLGESLSSGFVCCCEGSMSARFRLRRSVLTGKTLRHGVQVCQALFM